MPPLFHGRAYHEKKFTAAQLLQSNERNEMQIKRVIALNA